MAVSIKDILEKLCGGRYGRSADLCGGGAEEGYAPDAVLASRLIGACVLFAVALLVKSLSAPWPLLLLIAAALAAGYDMLAGAVLSIMHGAYFDRTVLIAAAALIAFCIGQPVEAAALVLLYQTAAMLIGYLSQRTRDTVMESVDCAAISARVETAEGPGDVSPETLRPGDRIILAAGDTVPCDCLVSMGTATVDRSPLGEVSEPGRAAEGDEILGGSRITAGTVTCEVTAAAEDSAAAAFKKRVAEAPRADSPVPQTLRKFFAVYTPAVILLAVLSAALLPFIYDITLAQSVHRALVLVVLASPCAMLAALPLLRLCGMAGAAKSGILFGCNAAADAAADVKAVIFDREGTLTDGQLHVTAVKSARLDADTLIKVTAHAMAYSGSALAKAIIAAYGGTVYIDLVSDFSEYPGKGVEVFVDGVRICAGTAELMQEKGVAVPEEDLGEETAVYVSVAEEYAGRILLSDMLRADAADAVAELRQQGVTSVAMVTGAASEIAAKTASALGIHEYYAGLDREAKRRTAEDIRRGVGVGASLMFAGGGETFGAEHSAADLDAVMCDAAALAAPSRPDILLLSGHAAAVPAAVGRAVQMRRGMLMSVGIVLLVKLVLLVLAFTGVSPLWFAVFMDSAAAMGTILLTLRLFPDGAGQPGTVQPAQAR